jgi:hypothetical protein
MQKFFANFAFFAVKDFDRRQQKDFNRKGRKVTILD